MSRQKGKRGERMLAAALRDAFPEYADEIRRGWQSREGDDDPDVLGVPGLWLESKFGRGVNVYAALQQAIKDSKGRGTPTAVIRLNNKEPFVALLLSDFLIMYRKVLGLEEKKDVHDHRSRRQAVQGSNRGRRIIKLCLGRKRSATKGAIKSGKQ